MTKILHVSLEYLKGVGGITAVTNGLLPALSSKDLEIHIVTPHYEFFEAIYPKQEHTYLIRHKYKGIMHRSIVTKYINENLNGSIITHYMIKPAPTSAVKLLFSIQNEKDIYQAFRYSEMHNRREYFNSAVAAFVMISNIDIPTFDIVQLHSWQTGIAACLIKEFVNLKSDETLNKIPHILTTIHMLSEHTQGATNDVMQLVQSFGLPENFADHFPDQAKFISAKHMRQIALCLLYSDCVNTVSKGLMRDVISNKSFGLDPLFSKLHDEGRLVGITNGITISNWDPSNVQNLQGFSYTSDQVLTKRKIIKEHIADIYKILNPNQIWLLYVGRFSEEKGIDMLASALDACKSLSCNLIVMGIHVTNNLQSIVHQQINNLKLDNTVLVIDDPTEQQAVGKLIRAASDFTIVPSHIEACGLVPMEALACGSIPITSDVQGISDVVIPLSNNFLSGTGFVYSDEPNNRQTNLKLAILDAIASYKAWDNEHKLSDLLYRLVCTSKNYDWSNKPASSYTALYKHILTQPPLRFDQVRSDLSSGSLNTHLPVVQPNFGSELYKSNTRNVLHVAMEYGAATFGGLGSVATQMVSAQNGYISAKSHTICASIITPYYSHIFGDITSLNLTAEIEHTYNNTNVNSKFYSAIYQNARHYMVAPQKDYSSIFDVKSISAIYSNGTSTLIDRIKYFNSAAAAFIQKYYSIQDTNTPTILILHDWHAALTQKLLYDKYNNRRIPSVFVVHVSNVDYGGYAGQELSGIGLNFSDGFQILKAVGLQAASSIVAVSPSFLDECMKAKNSGAIVESLRKLFVINATCKNNVVSIMNGFTYSSFCSIGRQIDDINNVTICKRRLKMIIAEQLVSTSRYWKIDPSLPVIFFIGRFSPEKGVGTFNQVIKAVQGKAIFFALGRGVTESLYTTIAEHSLKTDNIFISYSQIDQNKYGAMMRSCADFTFVPSHREACGLVPMEGFANGSICITSGVGGLRDSVTPLQHENGNYTQGNGFMYEDAPDGTDNKDLQNVINSALLFWSKINDTQKNSIHSRLINEAKSFDWLAPGAAIAKYSEVIEQALDHNAKLANVYPSIL